MAFITGSNNDDTINGTQTVSGQQFTTNGADTVYGRDGGDAIDGLGGNDYIVGGNGIDTINGGDGDDYLVPFGGSYLDVLSTATAADYVEGGNGIDTMEINYAGQISLGMDREYDVLVDITTGTERVKFDLPIIGTGNLKAVAFNSIEKLDFTGGAGNDGVTGGALDDRISTGDGDDVIRGAAGDDILGDELGVLNIDGGDGFDILNINRFDDDEDLVFDADAGTLSIGGLGGSFIFNVEVISFTGGSGNDIISGLSTLPAGVSFKPTLKGGGGNDEITGGDGAEVIRGDDGNDVLEGGGGNDTLNAGAGIDEVFGGAGDDLFEVVHHPVIGETYDGGSGRDTFQIAVGGGGVSDFTAASIAGFEVMHNHNFGLVDDTFRMTATQLSQFSEITLDAARVTIELADSASVIFAAGGVIDLDAIRLKDGGQSIDFSATSGTRLYDGLMGGDGDDVVTGPGFGGTTTFQTFRGFLGGGKDTFIASAANVYCLVSGEGGDDTLTGGIGNDTLNGGAGADALDGGGGVNTLTYATDTAGVTVNLATQTASGGEAAGDTIANFRNATGGSGKDTLTGDANDNVLDGQGGDDTINGGGGSDTIRGDISYTGLGKDTLRGEDGDDTIYGYGGDDTLIGGNGNDTLYGDTLTSVFGADVLEGGAGDDAMTGGAANDIFIYDGQGADRITDFAGGVGVGDVIRVTAGYTTFAQIQAKASIVSGGTQIDFGGGNKLTLAGFTGTLAADDFVFVGSPPPATGPEVSVTGNGVDIAINDAIPGTADGTDFGTAVIGTAAAVQVFTVTNTGDAPLTLTPAKLPKGFVLVEGLTGPLAPGASDIFSVRLDTAKPGAYTGDISFTTNDPDEKAYKFRVTGAVVQPEIDVLGNGISIKDGSKKALITNHTLFDAGIGLGDAPAVRTFTISNAAGAADLTISGATLAGTGFTLLTGLAGTVLAGGQSITFDVAIDTAIAGTRSATIQINNNDANEAAYDFVVTGTVGPRNIVGDDALNDSFVATAEPERFNGLNGADTVSYANGTGPVTASLLTQTKNTGFAAGDLYVSIENLIGSDHADTLTGNTGNNVLEGGAGADKLDGGTGIDTASYAGAGEGVTADLLKATNNAGNAAIGDTYKNIENLLGSAHNDTLVGNALANALDGGAGNDTLTGNGGIDTLTGGADADTFRFNTAKDGSTTGDIVVDFGSGVDSIGILRTGFKILADIDLGAGGTLDFAAHYFVSGLGDVPVSATNPTGVAATETGHGQFLFNQTTDQLWWDEDGSGAKKALLLATFQNGAHVTASDFDLL